MLYLTFSVSVTDCGSSVVVGGGLVGPLTEGGEEGPLLKGTEGAIFGDSFFCWQPAISSTPKTKPTKPNNFNLLLININ